MRGFATRGEVNTPSEQSVHPTWEAEAGVAFVAMFCLREPPPRDKQPMMVAITVVAIV